MYAADFLKLLAQTLPHTPLTHTSSRPSLVKVPLTRRTSPSLHSPGPVRGYHNINSINKSQLDILQTRDTYDEKV